MALFRTAAAAVVLLSLCARADPALGSLRGAKETFEITARFGEFQDTSSVGPENLEEPVPEQAFVVTAREFPADEGGEGEGGTIGVDEKTVQSVQNVAGFGDGNAEVVFGARQPHYVRIGIPIAAIVMLSYVVYSVMTVDKSLDGN